MATPGAVEQSLEGRLNVCFKPADYPGRVIKSYPDKPAAYKMLAKQLELLVVFRGGDFESPKATAKRAPQRREVNFEISVMVRSLGGHQGAYAVLEQVRLALQGWKPLPDADPIEIVRDTFLDVTAGEWTWAVFVRTYIYAWPAPLGGAEPGRITQLVFETPSGSVEVP